MKRTIITGVIGFALSSCATAPRTASATASATITRHDPYAASDIIIAPQVSVVPFPNSGWAYLVAKLDPTQKITLLGLSVDLHSQTGWYFLSSAADIEGHQLQYVSTKRATEMLVTVGTVESGAVPLTLDYLNTHASRGLNIRILGQNGNVIVKLPPPYVQGFLSRIPNQKPKQ